MKALFIDRDGTILQEPADEQIDSFEKFHFVPGVISALRFLRLHTNYRFVLVSNQDGLGTASYPEHRFWPTQNLMLEILKGEGIVFDDILIDKSFPEENLPTRKPGIAMLGDYTQGQCDLQNSFVIGDRSTDAQLARNLGAKALILSDSVDESASPWTNDVKHVASWENIVEQIYAGRRVADVRRTTKETDVHIQIDLDGTGIHDIDTGLHFFDHMLQQIAKHANIDLYIHVKGDLEVDEHHTIEDTAILLGQALKQALADKRGIERYAFTLPMDDCLASVAIDLGGRPWLIWNADFKREKIGDVPTEMFYHFFKSFSDAANINLNIKVEGDNEHHKIESIFKALARALRTAIKRDINNLQLPSSKGEVEYSL